MKCIHCQTDTSYPERRKNSLRCKGCKHLFAYEPKGDPLKVTDGMMEGAIKAVSGDGATAFTDRNLWYELNRRLLRGSVGRALFGSASGYLSTGRLVFAAALLLLGLFVFNVALPIIVLIVAGGVVLAIWLRRRAGRSARRPAVPFDKFSVRYLDQWKHIHGQPEKLMPPPAPALTAPPRQIEPDVTGYSFDRAVITDRAEAAALLLANNFHFENNCAVLSVDGHPRDVFETVITMLRRNPSLTVFALHDATPAGCALARRLREPGWFPEPAVRVVDLGLRPAQAEKLGLIRPKVSQPALSEEERSSLTPDEMRWFSSGESAELAALRPARLMRAVFQGFAVANRPDGDGSGGDGGGFFIWAYSDRADVYASDSFG